MIQGDAGPDEKIPVHGFALVVACEKRLGALLKSDIPLMETRVVSMGATCDRLS